MCRKARWFPKPKVTGSIPVRGTMIKIKKDEQVLCCPPDWIKIYENYMVLHKVPYRKAKMHDEVCFVLLRKYRPHAWKLKYEKAT